MQITQTTAPGAGILYDCATRDGGHLRLLVERTGGRRLFVYGPAPADTVLAALTLSGDEADRLADLLHSASIPDRLAEIERRLEQLGAAAPAPSGRTA